MSDGSAGSPISAQHDIVIVGGGMVGLSALLCLAQQGFDVALVEKNAPPNVDHIKDSAWPQRVVALNPSSQRFLADIGVWDSLVEHNASCASFEKIQVFDRGSGAELDFDSADLAAAQLGWIVANTGLRQVLWEKAQQLQTAGKLQIYSAVMLDKWQQVNLPNQISACVLSGYCINKRKDGDSSQLVHEPAFSLRAKLCVAADGAYSWLRQQAGIAVQRRGYRQQALVAVVQHAQKHQAIARQVFDGEQILALLPLSDPHHSSMVWSLPDKTAANILELPVVDSAATVSQVMGYRLGSCSWATPLQALRLSRQHATTYAQSQVVLVGDAAHSIHPLAGQGVNCGFADVACLAQQLKRCRDKGALVGAARYLHAYSRERYAANQAMSDLMDALKCSFSSQQAAVSHARGVVLSSLQQQDFLKRCLQQVVL